MDQLEPPKAFSFNGNVPPGRKIWLKHFDFHLAEAKKDNKINKDFHFSNMHWSKTKNQVMKWN